MRFPDVAGENLDGRPLVFPRDFVHRTIVLIAFDLKQRAELESWVPFVDRYARTGEVDGVVIAAISSSMRMMKTLIVTTMRKAAPNAQARTSTVPIFVDLDAFCEALQIADRSAIAVFVVEPDGRILGREAGPFRATAATAIEPFVVQST